MSNPFDITSDLFLVLANGEEQHSLWPESLRIPAGWKQVGHAGEHRICLDFIENCWKNLSPKSLAGADLPLNNSLELLPTLFEAHASQTPDVVAVSDGQSSLTYGELNCRGNQLAHWLIGRRIGPENLVGICLERSVEMVVSMLGIVKAGAGYLPLDPDYPKARMTYMLEDASPAIVFTSEDLRHVLPDNGKIVIIDHSEMVETCRSLITRNPNDADRIAPLHALHPAYVIYTSGSTGEPKGAVITHQNVVRLFRETQEWFQFGRYDVWTMFHSMSFDFSVWEIWGPLVTGGRLVIVPKLVSRSPFEFLKLLVDERVTILNQTPTAFYQLIEADGVMPDLGQQLSLRAVIFGGESLTVRNLNAWYARHSDSAPRLYNMYGITETTVHVTWQPLTAEMARADEESVIGVGIPDLRVYVLDLQLSHSAVGEIGELYIAGPGLARGYLNRPGLTAERFLADPLSSEPGERMYRSGDLARRRSDGNLVYCGRSDHQVKIRGFRIELAEIEATLLGHANVSQVAVVVRGNDSEDQRLAAYVVPDPITAYPLRRLLQLQRSGALREDECIELKNGMIVGHQNTSETDFVYQEIFEDRTYLKHGIQLPANACVFDVGANIGLFTMFVRSRCPRATILAFEPIPPLFRKLEMNSSLLPGDTRLFECGLSDQAEMATFRWYPNNSVISGRFADADEDQATVKSVLRNQSQQGDLDEDLLDQLVRDRLRFEEFPCRLRTLSDVIAEQKIERIDLLKIDVEKAELGVLQGISLADWPRISQLVIEVHDIDDRLRQITNLLTNLGFHVLAEQDLLLKSTNLFSVYARRESVDVRREESSAFDRLHGADFVWNAAAFTDDLRRQTREQLPEHMNPNDLMLLDKLPQTSNGKLDRAALPTPDHFPHRGMLPHRRPNSLTECKLERLFAEVLKQDEVGIDENFFQIGGHSLLAMRVAANAKFVLGDFIPIRWIFENPTIAKLAAVIDEQGRAKLIDSARQRQVIPVSQLDDPRPVPRTERLPLSYAQERLWFLDQYEQNRATYNVPWGYSICGILNLAVLEKCLRELVHRHESLRTTFKTSNEVPYQKIHSDLDFRLHQTDLRQHGAEDRQQRARQIFNEAVAQPFDLSRDLMLRGTIIRMDDHEYQLMLVMHHIASDGWSITILERDLAELYQAYLSGMPSPLPELSLHYADYAVWQRQWLQGEVLEQQLSYWKEQLSGIPVLLELPTDHPRPPIQGFRGGHCEVLLDRVLTESLKKLSRQENVTLFMTLLSGWQLLLSRYSGQTDIVVGAPIAGRQRSEFENLIGFFVNTLVLRANFDGNPTVRELLNQIRNTTLSAYAHQDVPFERLVKELNPPRSLNHSPVIQVMFVLQTASAELPEIPSLSLNRLKCDTGTTKFDLTLSLTENDAGLSGTLEYDTDLFHAETIGRMTEHFQTLLRALVSNPAAHIDRLPLLSETERHQLLVEWNRTQRDYPRDACIHQLFEQQVERNPQSIAVEFEEQSLTYDELNRRANQLAQVLRNKGIGHETRIGICLDRSLEMMVGLLAILKAGGAYVPLDPHYPDERLSFLISDTEISLILTQLHYQERCEHFQVELLLLDGEDTEWSSESTQNLACLVSSDSMACVIYTSGSTGVPKGVEVLHRGIVRLLCGADYVQLDQTQSVLQLAVLSFDASTFEIWGPLLHGGRSVLGPVKLPEPEELQRLLRRTNIRTLWLTSSLFNAIVDTHVDALAGVEQLLVGGEALSVAHIRRAQKVLGRETQLINGYGPTECTTFACCYRIPPEISESCASIPIGGPISNTKAYVLDPRGEPVPIGVQGELYLGGDGVARGYLNRPDLTAEKFLVDPFCGETGARMYRTGDCVRWRADAVLEFLGRRDQQVKIRGFRIEPGEIEAVLLRHPDVRQAAVLARQDRPGETRLIAYIVPRAVSENLTSSDLRPYLRDQLPDYMIPSGFVVLPELPVTPQGKLDTRALRAPEELRPEQTAPRTPTEENLLNVWKRVLGIERIGVHDNFFELGGHSLMALRLIDAMNRVSAKKLKVADLFSHPTVSDLAVNIDELSPEHASSPHRNYLESIRSGCGQTHLVIVGATLRAPLEDIPAEVPIWWLKLDGLHVLPHLDIDIVTQAAAQLAELKSAVPSGTIVLCGHSYGALLAMEIAHQLRQSAEYALKLVLLEPPPVWIPRENYAERIVKKGRSLFAADLIGKTQQLVVRVAKKIWFKLLRPYSRKRENPAMGAKLEDNWRYVRPYYMRHVQNYRCFSQPLHCKLHLIATPGYVTKSFDGLKYLAVRKISVRTVSHQYSHLDIARPENSHLWVDVVNSVIEKQNLRM